MGQLKNYLLWHLGKYGYEPKDYEHIDEYITERDRNISDTISKPSDINFYNDIPDSHLFQKNEYKNKKNKEDSSEPQKSWLLSITGLLLTVVSLIIGGLAIYIPIKQQPKFIIKNSILKSSDKIIILACNKKANQSSNLDIIFDGYPFPQAGILSNSNTQEMYHWFFEIKKYTSAKRLTKDGEHKIKVSLPNSRYSEEYNILFISVPPIVKIKKTNKTGQTIVKGEITTELQIPKKYLSVYITYYQEDKEYSIDIPLSTKVHKKTGITYFEFETSLQGLPALKPNDPNYSAPFWSINVIDQAGNEYYYEQSYAKFMAPGNETFGVGNIANVKIERLSDDISRQVKNIVRIVPYKKIIDRLPNGKTPIDLQVRSIDNAAKLVWQYNITSIEPLTLVYRDDKKIGASVTSEYIDYSMNKKAKYRVEQKNENVLYRSNESTIVSRSFFCEKIKEYFKDKSNSLKCKTIPTTKAYWKRKNIKKIQDKGMLEEIENGLRVYGVSYRKGNVIISNNSYNFQNSDIFIQWKIFGNEKYSFFYIGIVDIFKIFQGTSNHSYQNSILLSDNIWYYTRIKVNFDKTYSIITAIENYDIFGGTVFKTKYDTLIKFNEKWNRLSKSEVYIGLSDNFAGDGAYIEIKELKYVTGFIKKKKDAVK